MSVYLVLSSNDDMKLILMSAFARTYRPTSRNLVAVSADCLFPNLERSFAPASNEVASMWGNKLTRQASFFPPVKSTSEGRSESDDTGTYGKSQSLTQGQMLACLKPTHTP